MSDFGTVQLWHPAGVKVTLPVPVTSKQAEDFDYLMALKFVDVALTAGWMTNAPGLEQGEEKGECGWVVRTQKEGRTGLADVVTLYLVDDIFPKIKEYLNTDADRAEFERVSGLKLAKMPLYPGDNSIERGKNKNADAYVVRVPRPFRLVWKANPKWNEAGAAAAAAKNEPYKVSKRVLVSWGEGEAPAAPKAKQEPVIDNYVSDWEHFLSIGPPLAELNARLPMLKEMHEEDKRLVWDAIKLYAGNNRLAWSKERKQFEVTDNMADYL